MLSSAPRTRWLDAIYRRSLVPTFPLPVCLHAGRGKPFPGLESVALHVVDFLMTAGVVEFCGSVVRHEIHFMSCSPGVFKAPPLLTPYMPLWEACHLFQNVDTALSSVRVKAQIGIPSSRHDFRPCPAEDGPGTYTQ